MTDVGKKMVSRTAAELYWAKLDSRVDPESLDEETGESAVDEVCASASLNDAIPCPGYVFRCICPHGLQV